MEDRMLATLMHATNFEGAYRACGNLPQANLANVEWIVVTADTNIRVDEVGILPCAWETTIIEVDVTLLESAKLPTDARLETGC